MEKEVIYLALGSEIADASEEMELDEEYEVDPTYVGTVFKWDSSTDSIEELIEACIGWNKHRITTKEIYHKILFQLS